MPELLGSAPLAQAALLVAGAVAGALNVVAGGGSFLTLPLMIFLGLPPTVANGTNRIAILAQNVAGTWGFQRHGLVDRRWVLAAGVPATAGAILGSWAAIEIGEESFRKALALLMVAISLWTLWDPTARRRRKAGDAPPAPRDPLAFGVAMFAIGIYGGFVQAGIGFLLLAATTWAGLDLVRGNALKVLVVLVFTPITVAIFAWGGKIAWEYGAALAVGNVLGGLAGVRLTVLKGHDWVKRVVTVAVIAFAVLLWFAP